MTPIAVVAAESAGLIVRVIDGSRRMSAMESDSGRSTRP